MAETTTQQPWYTSHQFEKYQLFPIESAVLARVKESIDLLGYFGQNPVVVDQWDNVLDGHTRILACAELGRERPPSIVRKFKGKTEAESELEAMLYARTVQSARRQMSPKAMAELWEKQREEIRRLLAANPKTSDTEIARQTGVNRETAAKQRKELGATGHKRPGRKPQSEVESQNLTGRTIAGTSNSNPKQTPVPVPTGQAPLAQTLIPAKPTTLTIQPPNGGSPDFSPYEKCPVCGRDIDEDELIAANVTLHPACDRRLRFTVEGRGRKSQFHLDEEDFQAQLDYLDQNFDDGRFRA